jgi:hypothetical protein
MNQKHIDAEPTLDWSVEHALQWFLLKTHEATDRHYDSLSHSLQRQLDQATKELQLVVLQQHPTKPSPTTLPTTTATTTLSLTKPTLYITIVSSAVYQDKTFVLHPTLKTPCMLGRSTGKRYRDKGISLPQDPEVSTTHGRFSLEQNTFTYTDLDSTNGTTHQGRLLEPNVPLELHEGMLFTVGACVLKIDKIVMEENARE